MIYIEDLEGLDGLLYLRKSRKDIQAEKEAAAAGRPYDTLEKHRTELFRMVRNYKLNVVDVLEEVESGEFIAERPVFQEVLERLQEESIRWVGVMDEDRLGRGDKIDQGRIERAFKDSGTLIITPSKIVDMEDEADEMYMDYKGQGARYEYKQIKKRLHGGRRSSAAKGKYMFPKAPFGYIRGIDLKLNYPHLVKDYVMNPADMEHLRLYPHPEEAEWARLIFQWFLEGKTISEIGGQLKCPSPGGSEGWRYYAIHRILTNPVYTGTIRFGYRRHIKQETGKYKTKKMPDNKVQLTERAHEPLISKEDFARVQEIIKNRNHVPVNQNRELVNPLATLLKCHYCALAMSYRSMESTGRVPLVLCHNIRCKGNHSIAYHLVEERILQQVDEYYRLIQSDPKYKTKKTITDSTALLERKRHSLQQDLQEKQKQMDNLHDLLEQKVYTVEVFLERQKANTEKIKGLDAELNELESQITNVEEQKQKQTLIIPRIRHVLSVYRSAATAWEKNELLKQIIEAIYYDKPGKGVKKNPEFTIRILWKA